MTYRSFFRFFTKPVLTTSLVLFPIIGVYATARGATLEPTTSAPEIAPLLSVTAARPVTPSAKPVPTTASSCSPKLRRIKTRELSLETIQLASKIVREHYRDAVGTEISFDAGDKHFVGRIERHYHEFDSKGRPWGFHKGCSLFEVMPCE